MAQGAGIKGVTVDNQVGLELTQLRLGVIDRNITQHQVWRMRLYGLVNRRQNQRAHGRGGTNSDSALLIVAAG